LEWRASGILAVEMTRAKQVTSKWSQLSRVDTALMLAINDDNQAISVGDLIVREARITKLVI
jgi:hypothetical protein